MQWWQTSKSKNDSMIMSERVRREVQAISNMEICKPTLLQKYQKDQLSVEYYSNKNAWMTSGVFETWLKKLNQQIIIQLYDLTKKSRVLIILMI